MSDSFNLFRLQQLDLSRFKILRRQKEIHQIIDSDNEVQKAQKEFNLAQEQVNKAQTAYDDVHAQVEEKHLKLKYSQAKLFGGQISNPKELQDLEAESEALRRTISKLEEKQFFALETLDNAQETLKSKDEFLINVKKQTENKHANLILEHQTLEDKLPDINNQRNALRAQITPDIYKTYVSLLKSKRGRAVAEVVDSSCEACGVYISAGDIQNAQSPTEITYCKSCGRMLYSK